MYFISKSGSQRAFVRIIYVWRWNVLRQKVSVSNVKLTYKSDIFRQDTFATIYMYFAKLAGSQSSAGKNRVTPSSGGAGKKSHGA